MTQAMPQKLDEEKKAQVFDFVSGDIGNALMNRVNASKTAEVVLQKLEKVGWARQTISDSYSLEDFYGYAAKYGLPDAVKPWLEEFHLAIKNSSNVKPVHESAERTSGSLFIPTTVTVNGTNGSTAKASEPVAEG